MICVVFDIDGTLFDTKVGIIAALNETIKRYGGNRIDDTDGNKYIGPPISVSLTKYQHFNPEIAKEATDYYRKIYVEKYVKKSTLYEGTEEVLSDIKKNGNCICVATMKTYAQIKALLEKSNIRSFVEIVECAADDGSKSKALMLKQIKSKVKADAYYMVGDTMSDYEASSENGYQFVFASYGYGNCNGDRYYNINCIRELTEILRL